MRGPGAEVPHLPGLPGVPSLHRVLAEASVCASSDCREMSGVGWGPCVPGAAQREGMGGSRVGDRSGERGERQKQTEHCGLLSGAPSNSVHVPGWRQEGSSIIKLIMRG